MYHTFGGNEANLSTIFFISLSNCSSGKTLVMKPLEYASAAVILCPKRRISFAYVMVIKCETSYRLQIYVCKLGSNVNTGTYVKTSCKAAYLCTYP